MTEAHPAGPSRVGQMVGGKYRLIRLVGSGGMGEVYEAQHTGIGRRFAVKFLHPLLAGNDEAVARFQREAQAAGGLENENIAAVVDMGASDDRTPFLVMEYLDGEDLGRLLVRSGALSAPRATYITIQACRGLGAAHVRNIVHRDLKPENLYICKRNDGSDQVKILDFGIAKLHTSTGLTQTGTTMGTPYYMSPEQARGAREVDPRTDIYSLGVILYEMLSGAKPHPGDSYNEILYHVLTQQPTALDAIRPGLPPGLSTVVHQAMAREASDRFASAADFTTALIPFAGRAVTPARSQIELAAVAGETMSSPVSLPAMVIATPPPPQAIDSTAPARKRSRLWPWAVLAVVLAAAAGITILWPTSRSKPEPPPVVSTPSEVTASPAPVPQPSPAASPPSVAIPAPAAAIERPPEHAPGPRPARHPGHAGPASKVRQARPAASEGSTENPPRRKLIRSIDRTNPFGQ